MNNITIKQYIKENREQLVSFIRNELKDRAYTKKDTENDRKVDDKEIELWINNNEELYNEAKKNNIRFE